MVHGCDKDSNLVDRFSHICINICVHKQTHAENLANVQAAKSFSAPELLCSLVCNTIDKVFFTKLCLCYANSSWNVKLALRDVSQQNLFFHCKVI